MYSLSNFRRYFPIWCLTAVSLVSCSKIQTTTFTDRIDPLLSLEESSADPTIFQPFGMVQLTPITELSQENRFDAGVYNPAQKTFLGFEHFNLLRKNSSTTHPDVRISYELKSSQNEVPTFDKSTELAAVGRYAVLAEYSSNERSVRSEASIGHYTSLIEFIFPEQEQNSVKLEVLAQPNTSWQVSRADSFYVKISIMDSLQPLHSLIRLSMFPDSITVGQKSLTIGDTLLVNTTDITAVFAHFLSTDRKKQVIVNTGFSRINPARTESNFELDSQGWWLEGMVAKCKLAWRTHLSKFTIIGGTIEDQISFFTLHYRALRSISLLTESAGFYPKTANSDFGKDLNTDRYAWYGSEPSANTTFWLRSTEAVTIQQMGEDFEVSALRLPLPKSFYTLAVDLEEQTDRINETELNTSNFKGEAKSMDKLSNQLLNLSGIVFNEKNAKPVSFTSFPFTSFRMHLGGNAYYQRTEVNSKNSSANNLSYLEWFDNGYSF
jgi:hypothetical protein